MAVRPIGYFVGFVALVAGCQATQHVRDPEYARVAYSVHQARHAPDPTLDAAPPVFSHLEGPHAVGEYIEFALNQNPEIQAARKQMEAYAHQVPVAASLQDPMFNLTVQPEPVQTAAGQQEVILSAQPEVPLVRQVGDAGQRRGSTDQRGAAQLAAAELATIAKVKRAYYELYFIQQAISVTEAEQRLLGEIRNIANTRYQTGRTSQQDVLRADLEISNVENELIQLRQQLQSGQARLARLLHIGPQSRVLALDRLPPEEAPRDLDLLQRQAVTARPELHAQLAAIQRDRQALELARLDYQPDVTLGLSWIDVSTAGISPIATGQDSLLLTAGVNLPVYRKRLDSSVRSAEAKAVASARQYDSIRDGTLEEVTDLFALAKSQQEMLILFADDILPKARQTLNVSSQAYNVGEVDFLQLLDNWRQLLRYEVMNQRLQASLRQTVADLEQVVGGFTAQATETLPAPEPARQLAPQSAAPLE